MTIEEDMKEVLTKSFWQGLKKTFHEAMEESPANPNQPQAPAEGNPKQASTPQSPPSPAPGEKN